MSLVTQEFRSSSPKLPKKTGSTRNDKFSKARTKSMFGAPEAPHLESSNEKITQRESRRLTTNSNFALPGPPPEVNILNPNSMSEIPENALKLNEKIKMSKFLSKAMVNKPRKQFQKKVVV
jgi:hypothetical protein